MSVFTTKQEPKEESRRAVGKWPAVATSASAVHGHHISISTSTWDTLRITELSCLFCGSGEYSGWVSLGRNVSNKQFNDDIDAWDASQATTVGHLFHQATTFNQELNARDVSQITDMSGIFTARSTPSLAPLHSARRTQSTWWPLLRAPSPAMTAALPTCALCP